MIYNICENFRLVQKVKEKKIVEKYIGYSSLTGKEYLFRYEVYLLIRYINENIIDNESRLYECGKKYSFEAQKLINELLKENIIVVQNKKIINENIVTYKKLKYPLSKLSIELTNICNLNCIHCYGKFGKETDVKAYSYDDIVSMKHSLDVLHTRSIALTGGEVLINKDFERIALFFLINGFKLTIFTNGFCTKKLEEFLQKSTNYRFTVSISCDGDEKCHNEIRGNKNAYKQLVDTLNVLKKYKNVTVSISTTVMKNNLHIINECNEFIKRNFAFAGHYNGLVLPSDEKDFKSIAFQTNEFNELYHICPSLFDVPDNNNKLRCSGGVAGAALCADGTIKICSAAPMKECFIIGSLKDNSLENNWIYPNSFIKQYRKEKRTGQAQCKKCKERKKCYSKNCRIYADAYYNDIKKPSPIACFMVQMKERGKNQ